MFYSSYIINKLYDFTKKWLFFLENNGLKAFIQHQNKSNFFSEIFTEISHWNRGFRKLEKMGNPRKLLLDVFKSISFSQKLFKQMGLFAGQAPNLKNYIADLSKFKKKPVDSIKEMNNNLFEKDSRKEQENKVFITFTNLDTTNKNEKNNIKNQAESISPREKDHQENHNTYFFENKIKLKTPLQPINDNTRPLKNMLGVYNFNDKTCNEIWLNSNSTEEERMSYEKYHLKKTRNSKVYRN